MALRGSGSRVVRPVQALVGAGVALAMLAFCAAPADAPFHLWGGKRLSEAWDGKTRKLTFAVQGPAGLQDTVFLGGANHGLQQVLIGGKPAPFFFDPAQGTYLASPATLAVGIFVRAPAAGDPPSAASLALMAGAPPEQAAALTKALAATLNDDTVPGDVLLALQH